MVRNMGSEAYGVWMILVSTVSYVAWADLSSGTSLKLVLATQQHVSDSLLKRRLISAGFIVSLLNLPVYIVGGTVLLVLLPRILNDTPNYLDASYVTLILLIVYMFLNSFLSIPGSVLRGMNLDYRAMGVRSATVLGFSLLDVVIVGAGIGMIGLAANRIAGTIVLGGLMFTVMKRVLPWFRFSLPSKRDVTRLLRFSPWLYLNALGYILFQTGDVLLIGVVLGPSTASVYLLTRTLTVALSKALTPVLMSAQPGITDIYTRGELAKLRKVRRDIHLGAIILLTVFGSVILALNHAFVGLWVGIDNFAGQTTNSIMLLFVVFMTMATLDLTLLDAALAMKERMSVYFFSALVAALTATMLASGFGIVGFATGYLLGGLILWFLVQLLLQRMLKQSLVEYWLEFRRLLLFCMFFFTVFAQLGSQYSGDSWLHLLLLAVVQIVTILAILWVMGLTSSQRNSLLLRLPAKFSVPFLP